MGKPKLGEYNSYSQVTQAVRTVECKGPRMAKIILKAREKLEGLNYIILIIIINVH